MTLETPARRSIVLGGRAVEYLHRTNPRSRGLRITIDPGLGLVVATPPIGRRGWAASVTMPRIEAFLRERERWVVRHLDRLERERAVQQARGGASDGGVILYHGVPHRIRLAAPLPGLRATVVERRLEAGDGPQLDAGDGPQLDAGDGPQLIVRQRRGERRSIHGILEAWLRTRAAEEIEQAVARHAAALGVTPRRVDIRDPRTRWGSASRTGRLMFSWRLVLAPRGALDTVVVHELAHLRVFGHGPGFWSLVGARRPHHLADRAWLRRHAGELHAALETGDERAAAAG